MKLRTLPLASLVLSAAVVAAPAAASLTLLAPAVAVAQDDDDDDDEDEDDDDDDVLGEILDEEKKGSSVKEEMDALRSGDLDDRVGVQDDSIIIEDEEDQLGKRLIKVRQKKNFFKIGRFEMGPHIGLITNDPYIQRTLFGANFAYHITEVLSAELSGTFSPNFASTGGDGNVDDPDWTDLSRQLISENSVSPSISTLEWYSSVNLQYAPIYGKMAIEGLGIINFDIFANLGIGIAGTRDDAAALQIDSVNPPREFSATEVQAHPTTNIGGGFRVILGNTVALRVEARTVAYIETLNGETLQMKNNLAFRGAVTFFLGGGT